MAVLILIATLVGLALRTQGASATASVVGGLIAFCAIEFAFLHQMVIDLWRRDRQ